MLVGLPLAGYARAIICFGGMVSPPVEKLGFLTNGFHMYDEVYVYNCLELLC